MSDLQKIIVKNVSALTVSNLITAILGFISIIFISRLLDEQEVGKYYFLFSLLSIALLFGDLGINTYYYRQWSRENRIIEDEFNLGLSIKIVLSIVLIGIFGLMTLFNPEIRLELFIGSLGLGFDIIKTYLIYFICAQNKHELRAFIDATEKVIFVGLSLTLLLFYQQVVVIIIAFLCSKFYAFAHAIIYYPKKIRYHLTGEKVMDLLKKSWIFFFITIFISLYFKVDSVMLKYFKGYEEVGFYNTAYAIINVITILPEIIMLSIFPSMAYLCLNDNKQAKFFLNKAFYYIFLLAVPILIGGFVTADSIILTIFTAKFANSIIAFKLLIIAGFFVFTNYLLANYLICSDKQFIFLKITGFLTLLNIVLNIIFIPKYSYPGAAVTTIVTEFINFCWLNYYIRLNIKIGYFLKIILAGVMMGIVAYFLNFYVAIWWVIILSALFYVAISYALRNFLFNPRYLNLLK